MATKSKRGVEWAKAVRTFPNGRTVKFNLPVAAPAKKPRTARKKQGKGKRAAGRASSGPITNPARLLGSGAVSPARSTSTSKAPKQQKGKRGKKDKSGGQLQLLG